MKNNPSLAKRLALARNKKGFTQSELARLISSGLQQVKPQVIQSLESGRILSTRYLLKLAEKLDVSPAWLSGETGTDDEISAPDPLAQAPEWFQALEKEKPYAGFTKTVPIYGTASATDGNRFSFNRGIEVGQAERHPNQINYRDAFALHVRGDSMFPRYKEGELVYLIAGKPPVPGQDIVIDLLNDGAVIKEFVRSTAQHIFCKEYLPEPREISFAAADINAIYPVVGRG